MIDALLELLDFFFFFQLSCNENLINISNWNFSFHHKFKNFKFVMNILQLCCVWVQKTFSVNLFFRLTFMAFILSYIIGKTNLLRMNGIPASILEKHAVIWNQHVLYMFIYSYVRVL